MQDFMIWIPTQIFFGRNALDNLVPGIKKYGSRVLLVYGGGSIKKMGLYDKVTKILEDNNIYYAEYGGVEANPKVSHVRKSIEFAREHNIDLILPVGGGSVIDEAKGISGGYHYDGDVWDLVKIGKPLSHKIIPILTILTLAATGTEMSTGCNWTNDTIDSSKSWF